MSIEEILEETRALPTCTNLTFTEEECEVLFDNGPIRVYLPHSKEAAKELGADGFSKWTTLYIIKINAHTFMFRPNGDHDIFYCMCEEECKCGDDLGEEYDDTILDVPKLRVDYIAMLVYNYIWGDLPGDEERVKGILGKISKATLNEVLWTRIITSNSHLDGSIERGTVTLLLDAGADPNARNVEGWNSLYYYNSPDAVRLLLTAGADANVTNHEGESLFMRGEFQKETVRLLLDAQKKYDIGALSILLFQAIESGDSEYLQMLLNAGADPTDITRDGHTPLQYLEYCHGKKGKVSAEMKRILS